MQQKAAATRRRSTEISMFEYGALLDGSIKERLQQAGDNLVACLSALPAWGYVVAVILIFIIARLLTRKR
jgi:hypothetical protein